MHVEYRHLVKHCRLAQKCGVTPANTIIIEDGEPLSFTASGYRLEERVLAESLLVDGKVVGDVGRQLLRERRSMGEEGLVVVNLVRDAGSGELLHLPQVISRGFVFEQQFSHILEEAQEMTLEIAEGNANISDEQLAEKIRIPLRRFFRSAVGRNPMVLTFINSV